MFKNRKNKRKIIIVVSIIIAFITITAVYCLMNRDTGRTEGSDNALTQNEENSDLKSGAEINSDTENKLADTADLSDISKPNADNANKENHTVPIREKGSEVKALKKADNSNTERNGQGSGSVKKDTPNKGILNDIDSGSSENSKSEENKDEPKKDTVINDKKNDAVTKPESSSKNDNTENKDDEEGETEDIELPLVMIE